MKKWNAVRSKINETWCDIVCLQETKREQIDPVFLKNFCNPCFDCFEYLPSQGASGGTVIIWKGAGFSGSLVFQNQYATTVELTSVLLGTQWFLTNIYAPCTTEGKREFLQWFSSIDMDNDADWLIVGDFNLIRNEDNRNKPGGNINEMMGFNAAISNLGLVELPLQGKRFLGQIGRITLYYFDFIGSLPQIHRA